MAVTRESLTSEESALFEAEWDPFLTMHFKNRDVIDIFEDHKAALKEAVSIAKYELEATFGGFNAQSNEFGWMPIMPNFLLATTTPTYATGTWNRHITTANVSSRWIDWIGSSTSYRKIRKYATLALIGFANPVDEPKTGAILAKIKAKDYPVWYMQDAFEMSDYKVYELPAPIVVEKEQDMYLQTLAIQAGLDKLRPLGIYFAKGDHMRDKNAYAES